MTTDARKTRSTAAYPAERCPGARRNGAVLFAAARRIGSAATGHPPDAVTRPDPPPFIRATILSGLAAVVTFTLQPVASPNPVTRSKALPVAPRAVQPAEATMFSLPPAR